MVKVDECAYLMMLLWPS